MDLTKQQKIFIAVVGVVVIVFALIFSGVLPGTKRGGEKAALTVWGVDDEDAWRGTIAGYRKNSPNVKVEYVQINPANYEQDLLNALAAGEGPDVFFFNNRWLPKHGDKIVPALDEGPINLASLRELFPKVVEQDFVAAGHIYALPLEVDTLALVYNRDIFDKYSIALGPKTWDDFLSVTSRLRNVKQGNIGLPIAASIGGSLRSVPDAADILSLLMFQSGAVRADRDTGVNLIDLSSSEAETALDFYAQFALVSPTSTRYIWNDSFKSSLDTFIDGNTAMIFAYAREVQLIKEKNPFLDFVVRPAPQVDEDNPVNVADYWGLAVSNQSRSQEAAWDFVAFAATNEASALNYFRLTNRPPVLRSLIDDYLNHAEFGSFASQALTARSWYQADDLGVKAVFNRMIEAALQGERTYEILNQAEAELRSLERR